MKKLSFLLLIIVLSCQSYAQGWSSYPTKKILPIKLGLNPNGAEFSPSSIGGMTITAAGFVGIGTSNPQSKLEISNSIQDNHLRLHGTSPSLIFYTGATTGTQYARLAYATFANAFSAGSRNGDLVMQTTSDENSCIIATNTFNGNGIERVRVNALGRMGIATANPTATLHINCGNLALSGPSNIRFENLQTGGGNLLVIDDNGYVRRSAQSVSFRTAEVNNTATEALEQSVQNLKSEIASLKALVAQLMSKVEGSNNNEVNATDRTLENSTTTQPANKVVE